MQLMIDITAEHPAALRLAGQFLIQHAALRETMEGLGQEFTGDVPTGTSGIAPNATADVQPVPFPTPGTTAIAGAAPPIPASAPTVPPPPSNILPFAGATVPPPPAMDTAVTPPAPVPPVAAAPAPNAPFVPPVSAAPSANPSITNVAPVQAGASVPVAPLPQGTDEYDSTGIPFDARIHQKKKGVKKDGTWKLQKGIDQSVVESVMRELAPRIRKPGVNTPAVVGASAAPVSLPAAGSVPVPPPPPVVPSANTGVASAAPAVPVPPPPAPGAVPVPPPPPVEAAVAQEQPDEFRALIARITSMRNAGKLTPEEVAESVAAAGAPSLMLLKNMPHLIQAVNFNLDLKLATK